MEETMKEKAVEISERRKVELALVDSNHRKRRDEETNNGKHRIATTTIRLTEKFLEFSLEQTDGSTEHENKDSEISRRLTLLL